MSGFDVSTKIKKLDFVNQNKNNIKVNNSEDLIYISKPIYFLLAFFFGGLGAHKFYVRKYSSGILYLLFCWTCIPVFIGVYEAFRILFEKDL